MFEKIKSFLWMLVEAPGDSNKVSQAKLWSNIGMLAMTVVFLHMGCTNTLQEWYAWIYAPSVACPQLISKFIALRWGQGCQHFDNRYPEYTDDRYSNNGHSDDRFDNRYSDTPESEDSRDLRR